MTTKRKTRINAPREDNTPDFGAADGGPEKEPETDGTFSADTDRQTLPTGGAKRGEALQLSEEEDDFTDGRSSGGLQSRSQFDEFGGPDDSRASQAADTRLGIVPGVPEDDQNA